MVRRSYTITREVSCYPQLASAGCMALEEARDGHRSCRFNNCLTAMLYSAFMLEAYLNYLAKKKLDCWQHVKRLHAKGKLLLLSELIGYGVDFSRRPFQTFSEIFAFRNKLVHAGPEHLGPLTGEADIAPRGAPPKPRTTWETLVTLDNADLFIRDALDMMTQLNRVGLDEDIGFDTDGSLYWMDAERDEGVDR